MTRLPAAERRSALLAAALRVMAADGLAAATTRAICAEAGMAQSAFHYCFTSRDELLREAATALLADEMAAATDVIDQAGTIADTIAIALNAYWALVEDNPGAHQVLYEITLAALRDPDNRDIAERQYRGYLDSSAQILTHIARVRGIRWGRPLDVLSRQVVTVLDGLTLHYAVDRDTTAARTALDAFATDLAAAAIPHGKDFPA